MSTYLHAQSKIKNQKSKTLNWEKRNKIKNEQNYCMYLCTVICTFTYSTVQYIWSLKTRNRGASYNASGILRRLLGHSTNTIQYISYFCLALPPPPFLCKMISYFILFYFDKQVPTEPARLGYLCAHEYLISYQLRSWSDSCVFKILYMMAGKYQWIILLPIHSYICTLLLNLIHFIGRFEEHFY